VKRAELGQRDVTHGCIFLSFCSPFTRTVVIGTSLSLQLPPPPDCLLDPRSLAHPPCRLRHPLGYRGSWKLRSGPAAVYHIMTNLLLYTRFPKSEGHARDPKCPTPRRLTRKVGVSRPLIVSRPAPFRPASSRRSPNGHEQTMLQPLQRPRSRQVSRTVIHEPPIRHNNHTKNRRRKGTRSSALRPPERHQANAETDASRLETTREGRGEATRIA